MTVASLFCGIGGLDKGFLDNGFHIVWANDFDRYAVQTYNANYQCQATLADINTYPVQNIPAFDVLIGGFPCQPFSMMGEQRGFEDTRGTLFFRIAEIIDYRIRHNAKPVAIILENVRALRTHDHGHTFERIIQILSKDLQYTVFDLNLNSADYGVPQTRNRTYIVCFDNQLRVKAFPAPPVVQLQYYLQDVLEENVPDKYFLSEKIKKTILSDGSGGWVAKAETDLKIARPLCATLAKMHRASQDNYVTQNGRLRRLTPRECSRLQGFDGPQSSNFIIPVSDSQAYKQFGNAVTVNVSQAVALQVKQTLMNVNSWW